MTRHTPRTILRQGFTLVEMLVSTALILFVLLIITTVFTTGIGALRSLRAAGHLQDETRHAISALRRDLAAPHFDRETDGLRGPNLSQQRLDLYDWAPPKKGFFRISQGSPSVLEDADASGEQVPTFTATNHSLHFTVRAEPNTAQGNGRDTFAFTASMANIPSTPVPILNNLMSAMTQPGHLTNEGVVYSPWSEVTYFLRPSDQFAGTKPLYSLFRRRRVLPDIQPSVANAPANAISLNLASKLSDVSIYETFPANPTNGKIYINTPSDVTSPMRRLAMMSMTNPLSVATAEPAGVYANASYRSLYEEYKTTGQTGPSGDDILLENVLSFEIKVNWDIPTDRRLDRQTLPGTPPGTTYVVAPKSLMINQFMQNADYPFDDLPLTPSVAGSPNLSFGNDTLLATGARVFDTWCGDDKSDPNFGLIPYSNWNVRYENGNAALLMLPQLTPQSVTIPLRIRVKAIQIRLRIWDDRTKQTRQVTMVQDM